MYVEKWKTIYPILVEKDKLETLYYRLKEKNIFPHRKKIYLCKNETIRKKLLRNEREQNKLNTYQYNYYRYIISQELISFSVL